MRNSAGFLLSTGLKMQYNKPPLTFEEQAEKLISRGLVATKDELVKRLECVNYYRFTAYLYPYRNADDSYKENTTLEKVWKHYVFDRQLRLIVMDAIERIEVAIRTQLIYQFVHIYGAFGYLEKTNLPGLSNQKFNQWIHDLDSECNRSRETFIIHFKNKYGDSHSRLPLWMAAEIMSFGKMLTLFNGVEDNLKRSISRQYDIEDSILKSWLGALNVIRNICAHHGRLWNRELGYKPLIPRKRKYPEWHYPFQVYNNRIFCILTILKYLMKYVAPTSKWPERLKELLNNYPEISLASMGFPEQWFVSPIWKE